MPRIFISYRRSDSAEVTQRIYTALVQAFGGENVFKDVDSIPVGMDFRAVIERELINADQMLVVIGASWLSVVDEGRQRRLDDPSDFVRIEVEMGLRHPNVNVIPVLVNNASMPGDDDLPRSLYNLIFHNAAVIRDNSHFEYDIERLIRAIDPTRTSPSEPETAPRTINIPLIIGGIGIILLLAIAILLFINSGNTNLQPTRTPEPATAAVLLITERAGETLTSVAPTGTDTPDLTRTVDALVTQYFITATSYAAETIAAYTDTPTLAFAPSNTPVSTEDQNVIATQGIITEVLSSTPTPKSTETATFDLTGTANAFATGTQSAVNAATQAFQAAQATVDTQGTATSLAITPTTNDFLPLTAGNIEIGYALPGSCSGFSPDGTVLITASGGYDVITGYKRYPTFGTFSPDGSLFASLGVGVYDVRLGTVRFPIMGNSTATYDIPIFTPDGKLLVVPRDGVYDVTTGTKRFSISGYGKVEFNSDKSLLAVGDDGLYDVSTGSKRFSIAGVKFIFSPDSTLLAVYNDGVYEIATGTKRFSLRSSYFGNFIFSPVGTLLAVAHDAIYDVTTGSKWQTLSYRDAVFSPNGALVVVSNDGVYNVATHTKQFSISSYNSTFSPDGTLLVADGDGVYDVATGVKRFSISGYNSTFSPDGTFLVVDGDGVYDVATGVKRFSISGNIYDFDYNSVFSPNVTFLIVHNDGVYDLSTGNRIISPSGWNAVYSPVETLLGMTYGSSCVIYGSKGSSWPLQTGLLHGRKANIHSEPDPTSTVITSLVDDNKVIIIGRTPGDYWFKVIVGDNVGWVLNSVVTLDSLPDNVPVLPQ